MIVERSARPASPKREGAETRDRDREAVRYDLASARELNRTVLEVFEEAQVFRIDHYLGKETVQNLLAFRFANGMFEPVWNRNYIDNVQITAAEDIGIERRAGYYDHAGALRDLVQNHMLQLLALLAMEPPASFEANRVRDEKVKVLESIPPPTPRRGKQAMRVRAQYGPGVSAGRAGPGLPPGGRRRSQTRGPRRTRRCDSRSPTGAGRGCRSTCARASGSRAR